MYVDLPGNAVSRKITKEIMAVFDDVALLETD